MGSHVIGDPVPPMGVNGRALGFCPARCAADPLKLAHGPQEAVDPQLRTTALEGEGEDADTYKRWNVDRKLIIADADRMRIQMFVSRQGSLYTLVEHGNFLFKWDASFNLPGHNALGSCLFAGGEKQFC